MLHFMRNGNKFREQRYAISSSLCPEGVEHGLLRVEVTSDIDLGSISFMCFRQNKQNKYKSSVNFGSAYINMHVYCPASQE